MHVAAGPTSFLTRELLSRSPTGPRLWRLRFGASVLDAHLSSAGSLGCAYRLYLNDRFTYSERYATEDDARQAAADVRIERIADGWSVDGAHHLAVLFDQAQVRRSMA